MARQQVHYSPGAACMPITLRACAGVCLQVYEETAGLTVGDTVLRTKKVRLLLLLRRMCVCASGWVCARSTLHREPSATRLTAMHLLHACTRAYTCVHAAAVGRAGPRHHGQHLRRHPAPAQGHCQGQRRCLHPARCQLPIPGHHQVLGVPPQGLQGGGGGRRACVRARSVRGWGQGAA